MIGILYICTGKYVVFWKNFYLNCEKYFLPGQEKMYFVFTDAEAIFAEKKSNIQKFYQENLGWPNDTLLRFEIFLKMEPGLKKCDYLFFLNANMKFIRKINNDILPDENDDGLVAVLHPGFFSKQNEDFVYERNTASTAYIAHGQGKHYFMGGFNGGKTDSYLQLIRTLNTNIHKDLDNNLIAIWHDESHLNHYLLDKNPKILTPEYGFPENSKIPFLPKVIILNKNKFGGNDFLRNRSKTKIRQYTSLSYLIKKTSNLLISILEKFTNSINK